MALSDIKFFGAADKVDGKIGQNYPGWYHTNRLQDLNEEVEMTERALERGMYPNDRVPEVRAELKLKKDRLTAILDAEPNLQGAELDAVAKVWRETGEEIKRLMPTRTEMMKGWANPHEEANKMQLPCIDVGGHKTFFKNMGIRVVDGKINRNQAAQAWKIMGKAMGEPTNVERLRQDAAHGVYHDEPKLEDMR